jgi:hypothetical protein
MKITTITIPILKKECFYKENLEVGALYLPKIPQICESVTTFVITTAVFVTFTESKLTIKCQCLRKIKNYWVFLHTVHKYIIGQKAGKEYDTAQESHEYNA